MATYTAIGQSNREMDSRRYRLAITDTSKVMTAPHAARSGRSGCGGVGAGTGHAVSVVQERPSQNRTAALFHGSGNQPAGVGNIVASVRPAIVDCVVSSG